MMRIDANYVISAIDDVLQNKSLLKWDYLLSVEHHDKFARKWADRLREVERQYPSGKPGHYLSEEGLVELEKLRTQIR